MLDNAAHLTVGDVTQINTRAYNRSGSSKVNVNVNDGAQYSSNVEINTGIYQEIRGDDPSLRELYAHISTGCMHNSAARVDAPKCHDETRKAVQDDVFSWMSRGAPDEVLWLTGPAGAGKSAIMGTVCDKLKESGQLAASFFFAAYLGRTSKESFVTTLAYQLQRHPHIRESVSQAMLGAVRRDPAVFEMSLREQVEALMLQPLRSSRSLTPLSSTLPMAIVIDGVDECGDATYASSGRSRQGDQTEVLSILLQAIKDPAFPFRVIVASRPETWIRTFFTASAAGKFTEIFLDDKYSPDDDIRLFLKSKFAELCRRYGLDLSTWPPEEAIDKLVEDASGQFIYVATVVRFIDTPGTSPHGQLDIVLKIKPRDTSNPFAVLDALYTSILQSTSTPGTNVLWLKAVQRFQMEVNYPSGPSAWTVNRLLESHAGQAQTLLGDLPSLTHIPEIDDPHTIDSRHYGNALGVSPSIIPRLAGWSTFYAFYHKSFLDYLQDTSRCDAAFPGVGGDNFDRWIQGRFARTLKCGGPEVPVHPSLLLVFQRCLLDLLVVFSGSAKSWKMDDDIISECEPMVWLDVAGRLPSFDSLQCASERSLYRLVHNDCRFYRPCNPGCKQWRRAISKLSNDRWRGAAGATSWTSVDLLRDRFKIERLRG